MRAKIIVFDYRYQMFLFMPDYHFLGAPTKHSQFDGIYTKRRFDLDKIE